MKIVTVRKRPKTGLGRSKRKFGGVLYVDGREIGKKFALVNPEWLIFARKSIRKLCVIERMVKNENN